MEYKGYRIEFYRRRYPGVTYTWISVNGEQPCDPVAKIKVSKEDIEFAIDCYEARRFEEWMKRVDGELKRLGGLSSLDFPYPYKQEYEEGHNPIEVARRIWKTGEVIIED